VSDPAAVVDARGLQCPLPVFHARDALFDLRAGDLLEVLADDPQAPSDFESWCPKNGHRLVGIRPEGRAFKIFIEKGDDG
jgi:TusA-related sulfurtransferase